MHVSPSLPSEGIICVLKVILDFVTHLTNLGWVRRRVVEGSMKE